MAFLGGLVSSLLGGISGAANPRPPALNPLQTHALNSLLGPNSNLMQLSTGTPTIDPIQQALMFGQNAQGLTGANNAITHVLTSRGLGRSGLLGAGLMQNQNQSQVNQGNIDLNLQQQAIQRQQAAWQQIAQLLNVNATPGQSGFGGFMAGMAPVAAYSIQNALNSGNNPFASFGGQTGQVTTGGGFS